MTPSNLAVANLGITVAECWFFVSQSGEMPHHHKLFQLPRYGAVLRKVVILAILRAFSGRLSLTRTQVLTAGTAGLFSPFESCGASSLVRHMPVLPKTLTIRSPTE